MFKKPKNKRCQFSEKKKKTRQKKEKNNLKTLTISIAKVRMLKKTISKTLNQNKKILKTLDIKKFLILRIIKVVLVILKCLMNRKKSIIKRK